MRTLAKKTISSSVFLAVAMLTAPSSASPFPYSGSTNNQSASTLVIKDRLLRMGFIDADLSPPLMALAINLKERGQFTETPTHPGKFNWVSNLTNQTEALPEKMSSVSFDVISVRAPLPVVVSEWENKVKEETISEGEWKSQSEEIPSSPSCQILAMRQKGSGTLRLTRFTEGPEGVYILDCRLSTSEFNKDQVLEWVKALHEAKLIPFEEARRMMSEDH